MTFIPALLLFVIGASRFMRSNRVALADAEKRVERRINPRLRENRHAHAQAGRLAARSGHALSSVSAEKAELAVRAASGRMDSAPGGDQLRKLTELMGQGILTEEEYAVAKAKPLG